MKLYIFIIVICMLLFLPAIAAADNGINVIKPIAYAGAYGTGIGQIDTPLCVRVDANDSVFILQDVQYGNGKVKTVMMEYDKNLTFLTSFDVLKKTMVDVGWDGAGNGFYYDNLAKSFDIDQNGNMYVLCGWDVVVYDKNNKYQYQFPVSSFMGWIDKTNSDTSFYYPHGIAISNDGYVVLTSGDSPDKHEIMLIYPNGKLFTKLETPVNSMYDLVRDKNGSLYIIENGTNTVHVYDPTMTKEKDISFDFNGTYEGNPTSLAFLSGGNVTVSANGIFIYDSNGSTIAQFMDNNLSENNRSWDRLVATNSSDYLFVVSSKSDAGESPQPIAVYQFNGTGVVGAAEPDTDICGSVFGMFGFAIVIFGYMKFRS